MNHQPTWFKVAIAFFCALFFVADGGCKKPKTSSKTETKVTTTVPVAPERKTENNQPALDTDSGGILGVKETVSVRSILDGMVAAYKNAQTYRDCGEISVSWTQNGQVHTRRTVYRTSFQRPNRLLLEVNKTGVLADGEKLCAYTPEMPGMLLRKPCPEKLDFLDILSEREIYWAITDVESNRFCYLPPPLVLLLSDKPLDTFLYQIEQANITLLPSEKYENHNCYRISARRGEEETIFWIDEESSILRRIRLPVQLVQKETSTESEREEMVTTLDFHEAELNWSGTLEMRAPANAVPVTSFMNPQIQMLGKPFPNAEFVTLDERPWKVTEGKTFFIFFWSVYETNLLNFRNVEEIYQQFKNHPDLTFVGVNIDPPSVGNEKVLSVAQKNGLTCPIVRDTSGNGTKIIRKANSFIYFLIDAKGIVQTCDSLSTLQQSKVRCDHYIQQVLNGKDAFPEQIMDLKFTEQEYQDSMRAQIENGIFLKEASVEKITIATKKIMPASEPVGCKKMERWSMTDLHSPSAVLPLPERDKILVLENGNTIVTLDTSGNILNRRVLEMSVDEYYLKIRASKPNAEGKRYFAVIGKRVALFDDAWNPISICPTENSMKNHPVMKNAVSDAILEDLDEDGEVELYVAFWNESGIHKLTRNMFTEPQNTDFISPQGREVQNVFQMVGTHTNGKAELRVVDQSGNITIYDPKTMEVVTTQKIAHRTLSSLTAFDFENDGTDALAALSLGGQGKYKAVGLTPEGTEVWNIDLPNYVYQRNIEKIHPLFIKNGNEIVNGWLLIGADSSLFLADPTGMIMDQFYYGDIITGCASAVMNGKPILLIATPQSVTALEIVR